MDVLNQRWRLEFGAGPGGKPILVILAGKDPKPVLITDGADPTLFNHIIYVHNKRFHS